jgi:hypothetical protein
MANRGLFKAIVRNIPSFLTKNEFYLGLNVSLPVTQWYFCQGGSQAPSSVALSAWAHSSSNAFHYSSLSMRVFGRFGGSQEFSVAYFGFDDTETLHQFIKKYDNFVIEVDHKQKYVLQVSRATFQTMPSTQEDCKP